MEAPLTPAADTANDLLTQLWQEIPAAAQRVYQLDGHTECQSIALPSGRSLSLKREDRSRVHSYKWRGAFNKMAALVESGETGPMVAASAGNHAQGVALSAARLGVQATIFMPRTTPELKQAAVRRFGGPLVDVQLVGDNYDQAAQAAHDFLQHGGTYIHPFDDLHVIAGQATIGLELLEQTEPDLVLLTIGGGGMTSGVAAVLRRQFPNTRIIGVEAEGQQSMGLSIRSGSRQCLKKVNRFCDGTAVATPGELTYQLCSLLLDDVWTVNDREVCTAIEWLWDEIRSVVEPSAGIGVAAALATDDSSLIVNSELESRFAALDLPPNPKVLTILSGANVDFLTLPTIARKGRLSLKVKRYYQFEIPERSGTLIGLLDQFMADMNIIDFQYGKTKQERAFPVIGVEGPEEELNEFEAKMQTMPLHFHPVTNSLTVEYRVVPFNTDIAAHPVFATIEFPDRPGALREFMHRLTGKTNVCYFNYTETGQSVGQALMGFEFPNQAAQDEFRSRTHELGVGFNEIPLTDIAGLG